MARDAYRRAKGRSTGRFARSSDDRSGSSTPEPRRAAAAAEAAILGLFNVEVAGFVWAVRRTGRELPERISLPDLLLLGVATHRLSRLITKGSVTSPIRAPFTEYQGAAEGGEVKEKARGEGLQLAIGDLFT